MKVLIAEDDAANRRLLEVTLSRWGYEVVSARDGEEAWKHLQGKDAPTLAVLDWMMPGMDGVEVCRKVRQRFDTPYVYLILLTSKDQKGDSIAGMDAGADDYLVKPFDPHELQVRLRAGQRVLDLQAELIHALTEQQRAHEALKKAQSHLVQSEKMVGLGQMVAGVAHEINNPLAFVSNNFAILERDLAALRNLIGLYREGDAVLEREQTDLFQRIQELGDRIDLDYTLGNLNDLLTRSREGLRRIQQIVRDLRDFARLDESDQHSVDLNAGIESTINIIAGRAHDKQVHIEKDLASLPLVLCHPAKINQVVMNLLANAIDASKPGDTVTVRTRVEDSAVVVAVADTGSGIAPAIRDRIFDPFFTTKPPGEGTGLGLSISYGIVQDHGGTIEVASEPGQGALFTVRLPIRSNAP